MIKNGKRLEQNIKTSARVQGIWCYRLRDSASSFNQTDNLRFTTSNMCDTLCFNGKTLACFELKNHKGKSIPLSCIRKNQVDELTDSSYFKKVKCGLIVNFEDINECYFLNIIDYNEFVKNEERKSIPISYFKEKGKKIVIQKKKVNAIYRIDLLMREI